LCPTEKRSAYKIPPAQVESFLREGNKGAEESANSNTSQQSDPPVQQGAFSFDAATVGGDAAASQQTQENAFNFSDFSAPHEDSFMGNGALMGLGYSETLPPIDVQEELYVLRSPDVCLSVLCFWC
jgi:hypothetical protein